MPISVLRQFAELAGVPDEQRTFFLSPFSRTCRQLVNWMG